MWDISEGCGWCKSKAGAVIKTAKCSECAQSVPENDFLPSDGGNAQNGGGSDPVPIATTETNNASSDGVVPFDLGILQKSDIDPLSVATTKSNDASPDLGNLQNPSSKYVSISQMSERLFLAEIVTDHANGIYKQVSVGKKRSQKKRNALFAACIYVACRQLSITRSMEEISSVANGVRPSDISNAVESIAETLGIRKDNLMDIKPADFIIDNLAYKAHLYAVKRLNNKVDSKRYPVSIAAAITYHTALVYHQRKLLNAIIKASGVEGSTILETFKELYPDLSTTPPPKEFTKAKDSKNIGST